jgi:hypothetical protein
MPKAIAGSWVGDRGGGWGAITGKSGKWQGLVESHVEHLQCVVQDPCPRRKGFHIGRDAHTSLAPGLLQHNGFNPTSFDLVYAQGCGEASPRAFLRVCRSNCAWSLEWTTHVLDLMASAGRHHALTSGPLKSRTKSAWGGADTGRPCTVSALYCTSLTTNLSRPPSTSSAHGFRTLSPPPSRALFICALFRGRDTCASKYPATVERALRNRCGTMAMWPWAGCTIPRPAEFWMYRHRGRVMPSSSQPASRAR